MQVFGRGDQSDNGLSKDQLNKGTNPPEVKSDNPLDVIDIAKINDAIRQGKQIITGSAKEKTDHIVIFWGRSGKGKSSAIIILNGQGVKGYYDGAPILIEENVNTNQIAVKIQTNANSGTIYPAVLEMKKKGVITINLWDMPGLGQNRGVTQSLTNSYFIHRIFEFHKQVKLFFTLSYTEILPNNRAEHLEQQLKDLMQVLGKIDDYYQSVALMITKVRQSTTQEQVIQFFKQILEKVTSIKQNKDYCTFIKKVIDGSIPIMLVRQPDFSPHKKLSRQHAILVTDQYSEFIEQARTIITTKLKSASFAKLHSVPMSQQEVKKCKPIVDQTHSTIEKHIDKIEKQLKTFVLSVYNKAVVSQKLNEVEQSFKDCQKIGAFINRIQGIVLLQKFQNSTKDIKYRFDHLQALFEEYNFLCEKNKSGQPQCLPMVQLNDQYIMIKFLLTLNFNPNDVKFKWKNETQVVKDLFLRIREAKLKELWQAEEGKFHQKVKNFIQIFFNKEFINQMEKQKLYLLWKDNFSIFPSFLMSSTNLDTSKDALAYFEMLSKDANICKIQNKKHVDSIIKILNFNNKYLSKKVDSEFIKNSIKPPFLKKGKQMIGKAIRYETWEMNSVRGSIQSYSQSTQFQRDYQMMLMKTQLNKVNQFKEINERNTKNLNNSFNRQKAKNQEMQQKHDKQMEVQRLRYDGLKKQYDQKVQKLKVAEQKNQKKKGRFFCCW